MSGSEHPIEWYLARDGQQFGPLSDVELKKFVELGHLRATDLLWRHGFSDWRPASSLFPAQRPAQAPAAGRSPNRPHGRRLATARAWRASPGRAAQLAAARLETPAAPQDMRRSGQVRSQGPARSSRWQVAPPVGSVRNAKGLDPKRLPGRYPHGQGAGRLRGGAGSPGSASSFVCCWRGWPEPRWRCIARASSQR